MTQSQSASALFRLAFLFGVEVAGLQEGGRRKLCRPFASQKAKRRVGDPATMEKQKQLLGKVLIEQDSGAMKTVAQRYGMLVEGKIDLRERAVRFRHSGLDIRDFLLEGSDLSGSRLINCTGEGARFDRCVFRRVWIAAEKTAKISFRGASFAGAVFADSSLMALSLRTSIFARRCSPAAPSATRSFGESRSRAPICEGWISRGQRLSTCTFGGSRTTTGRSSAMNCVIALGW